MRFCFLMLGILFSFTLYAIEDNSLDSDKESPFDLNLQRELSISIENPSVLRPNDLLLNPQDEGLSGMDENSFSHTLKENRNLWTRIINGYQLSDVRSERTNNYERWYANRPDYVQRMIGRGKRYLYHIFLEVEKRGMPSEIALVPMIESAFNPRAKSFAQASGIWQFIPSTGKDFGLKQNWWKDERRNIMAATDAALSYLQRLYVMFGSWDLALAAYNAGEGTVKRAIERNRRKGLSTSYSDLVLPLETKDYVPKLQAIKNIVTSPEAYGITLDTIPDQPYFSKVVVPNKIDTQIIATLAGISLEEFILLNPEFSRPLLKSDSETHQILLPVDVAQTFKQNLAIYDKPLTNWTTYYAKRGENLNKIAAKFGIELSQLKEVNELRYKYNKLSSTQFLLVPKSKAMDISLIDDQLDKFHQSEENHQQVRGAGQSKQALKHKHLKKVERIVPKKPKHKNRDFSKSTPPPTKLGYKAGHKGEFKR